MTALTVALAVVGTTFVALPIYSLGVRRLLGLRLGLLRTLIAGAIALLVVSPIISELSGSTFAGQGVLPGLWFVILGVAIALLAGMAYLVVAEVFVPSVTSVTLVEALRSASVPTAHQRHRLDPRV